MRQALVVWRVMPAISAALFVVSAVAFSVAAVEQTEGLSAQILGYDGGTVRIVAVRPDGGAGPSRFTQWLIEFSDVHGVSVAYSADSESGVVGLYDPLLRFRGRSGALFAPLAASGSRPVAVLSTALPADGVVGSGLLTGGVAVLGTFRPEVQFDARYPAVLTNLPAAQPGSGVYLFAGLRGGEGDALLSLFSKGGLDIKNLAVREPATVGFILSTLYGGIVMAFAGLSILGSLLVTHIHSFLLRRRLVIAAVLGATAGDLRRLLLERLVPLVAVGIGAGALAALGVLLSLRDALQTAPGTIAEVAVGAVAVCVVVWVVILGWVSSWEVRRCRRVLSR
jgi:hypothetical protein